jgi:transcription-repair coupling factor (superfamily II helicase)
MKQLLSPFAVQPDLSSNRRPLHHASEQMQSIIIAALSQNHHGTTVVITENMQQASRLVAEVDYWCQDSGLEVALFPDRETLPYDHFSPHQDLISQRLKVLHGLLTPKHQIVITPVANTLLRLMPQSFLQQRMFDLKLGQNYPIEHAKKTLTEAGYYHVNHVHEHGEFAVRGALIDIFPMGAKRPFRVELFDDEIDTIRTFDPDTQRSLEKTEHILLLPAQEFPIDGSGIERFRQNFRQRFESISKAPESIYRQVSQGIMPAGIESYLPLFFEHTEHLFDYLTSETQIITLAHIEQASEQHLKEVQQRFDSRFFDPIRPLLQPETLYMRTDEMFQQLKKFARTELVPEPQEKGVQIHHQALPNLHLKSKETQPLAALLDFLKHVETKVVFSVESKGRAEIFQQMLLKAGIKTKMQAKLIQRGQTTQAYGLCVTPILSGFVLPEDDLCVICETDLIGPQIRQKKRRRSQKSLSVEQMIQHLEELKAGQAIVHVEHGIGRYLGLEYLPQGDFKAEFLKLEYAQEAILYVPISSLHLIYRYSGNQDDRIALSRLGNKQWEKEKKRAVEKMTDVAAQLLDIYAQRAALKGQALTFDAQSYQTFADQFPFAETVDQQQVIDAVIDDLQQSQPMDRLVCGDVGFGKTEVAMRAAFIAVQAHKQVAILVPTTLLVQQHTQNFQDRFADWPIEIAGLSRFQTSKEQKQVIEKMASGQVDVVIGTHKLLNENLKFKDLGLLIVDEEHRFGVRHKEQIKRLRAHVNILTMTATPIPRTLNMAMSGIRDLSIIATPPAKRLSVKTFVHQKETSIIKEALLREVLRGGQVYFLHNDITSIERCAQDIIDIIPEARVTVAHGQMRERDLEQVMSDFYHRKYNVLVCTTIIETGIDVPTANTIVIDRADKLGLAQLHQLRGRVGRSHHQAYAYLLTPPTKLMTKDAQKRLEAISAFEDLGSGFLLATQDLEIRGAGHLLGDEQSGHIEKMGFTLYMEMLEEAIEALKHGQTPSLEKLIKQQCEVDLRLPALLPEDYIFDTQTRLSLYKRLASCKSTQEIDQLQIELIDRFGLLPEPAKYLFHIAYQKLIADAIGLKKIELHHHGGSLEFNDQHQVAPEFIISLLQNRPNEFQIDGATKLKIRKNLDSAEKRFAFLNQFLQQLQENSIS